MVKHQWFPAKKNSIQFWLVVNNPRWKEETNLWVIIPVQEMGNNKIIRLKVNPMPSAAAHGYPFCFTPSGCVAAFHPREAAAGERLTLGADQKSWAAKVFDSAYAWLEILESLQETMVFTVFTYSRQTCVIYHRTYCRKIRHLTVDMFIYHRTYIPTVTFKKNVQTPYLVLKKQPNMKHVKPYLFD